MIVFKQMNHYLTPANPDLRNHIHIMIIPITVIIQFMLIVMTRSRAVVVVAIIVERGITVDVLCDSDDKAEGGASGGGGDCGHGAKAKRCRYP